MPVRGMESLEMGGLPTIKESDMPWVTFITKTEEDRAKTVETGEMVFKDTHYAVITPVGSKDRLHEDVSRWWPKLHSQVQSGRLPRAWMEKWKADFELYKKGQEIPLNGTPIKGWNLVPGSIQETMIRANILTVESLANANAEALQQIGIGAVDFKRRAQAWIEQHTDKAGLSIKMAAAQKEIEALQESVKTLESKNAELTSLLKAKVKKEVKE